VSEVANTGVLVVSGFPAERTAGIWANFLHLHYLRRKEHMCGSDGKDILCFTLLWILVVVTNGHAGCLLVLNVSFRLFDFK
jgi:hypothetical protein